MESTPTVRNWLESIVKGRRGDIQPNDKLCIGTKPPPTATTEKNGLKFCNGVIWVRTYVNSNFVSLCKLHSTLLHEYLDLYSNSQKD